MSKDEKKKTTMHEDVMRAREVWFKELLEKFLPEALDKVLGEGRVAIPPSCVEEEKDAPKDFSKVTIYMEKKGLEKMRKIGLKKRHTILGLGI